VSYSYGASSAESAFHVSTRWDRERGRAVPLTGFVLRDGETTGVADGACEVSRDDRGRPVEMLVRGTDSHGQALEAVGRVVSRMALPSTPWFVWACLVRWTLADGSTAYGEHQDAWSPRMLRAFLDGAARRGA
jgi:hypothetical protein